LVKRPQIGFIFLVPAHAGSPGQRAVQRVLLFLLYASVQYRPSTLCKSAIIISVYAFYKSSHAAGRVHTQSVSLVSVCLSVFPILAEMYTQTDSPGGSTRRGQRTFRSFFPGTTHLFPSTRKENNRKNNRFLPTELAELSEKCSNRATKGDNSIHSARV